MPDGSQPWQGYHIYGCQVDPAHVTWYIDGVQTNQIATPTAYITSPFYIMIDYAIGGGWPLSGIVNNSSLNVDWVRVYSLPVVIPNENTISINFAGPSTSPLQPASVAGAPGYTGSNWNVFTGAGSSTPTLLKNAAGSTAAGVTMKSFSSVMAYLIDSAADLTPDEELFAAVNQSYSAGTPTLNVNGIPYTNYSVVVYLESDSSGRTGSVSVSGSPVTYYYSTVGGGNQPASYILVTSTTAGAYTPGNYVVFTGLSGTSQTITMSETQNEWSGMCGVQIVPPPFQMPYIQWASQYFTTQQLSNPSISGEAATPVNDGVANLLKYLCDINPVVPMTASTWAALPAGEMTTISGSSYLTLTCRESQWLTGITLNLQTSPDLHTWKTVTPSSIVTTGTDAATGDSLIQFQVPVTPKGAAKEFIRLNVTGS
jgi:beta-glucanase (GH16 family)